jgi:hypothetical protein
MQFVYFTTYATTRMQFPSPTHGREGTGEVRIGRFIALSLHTSTSPLRPLAFVYFVCFVVHSISAFRI